MKIVVCGREFAVLVEDATSADGATVATDYIVDVAGERCRISVESETPNKADSADSAFDTFMRRETESFIRDEIRLDVYCKLRGVTYSEIVDGDRPDLISEFVTEFGASTFSAEEYAKHEDYILDGMSNRADA